MSQSLSEKLIADAELEAVRILGTLRMTVALTLLVWINASLQLDQRARPNPDFENTQTVTIALGGFFFIGLASFILARVHLFRSWMAFVFTAIDAATLSLGLYAILASTALKGNWLPALPGVWLVPLLLSLGAVRYRPSLQVWATCLLLLGLVAATLILGFDPDGPATGAGPQVDHLFSVVPMLIRGGLLTLTGLIMAVVMQRARALLLRAVTEASYRANLARFLPTEIAPLVGSDMLETWRQGRRQQVAMLFVDMRDSTAIAEHMDPKHLSEFMGSFRQRVLRAAEEAGGVVDKFIGDGALIVFGVPEPRPDDAARAIACARELLHQVNRWNVEYRLDPPIRVGIGVHAGQVWCGLVGDDTRLEFTVLGDAVNVAARIEEATKQLGAPLLASEAVLAAAGELNRWQVVSTEPLRGRANAVPLLAPVLSSRSAHVVA